MDIACETKSHREEDPLKHLAPVIGVGLLVKRELVLLVIVVLKVEQNRRGLEHREVVAAAVDDDWDTAVWVQLDEPRLLLDILGDVNSLDTGAIVSDIAVDTQSWSHTRIGGRRQP